MSCRAVVLAVVFVTGCADNVLVMDVAARATFEVDLGATMREPLADETEYQWELLEAPESSTAQLPVGGQSIKFIPDLRGVYVIERWINYGLSERLTHRYVVYADGVPPTAVIRSIPDVSVEAQVALDASASASREQRALVYRWRLAGRPASSNAMILDSEAAMTSFTADAPGAYEVELAVFDGELWSAPHATLEIAVD